MHTTIEKAASWPWPLPAPHATAAARRGRAVRAAWVALPSPAGGAEAGAAQRSAGLSLSPLRRVQRRTALSAVDGASHPRHVARASVPAGGVARSADGLGRQR